jgi:hypothetical protein
VPQGAASFFYVHYKELKLQVSQGALLAGQRTETAAQQAAAMMIACSLLAEERLAIAEASSDKTVRHAGVVHISFCPAPGIHCGAVHGAAGFAGTYGWSCPSRTGQTSAGSDRRGGPATTTLKNLPAQGPPPRGQMAPHDEPLFIVHPQDILPSRRMLGGIRAI